MYKPSVAIGILLILCLAANPLQAQDDSEKKAAWATFSLNAGAFLAEANTTLRLGSGLGVSVDVEEALGLDVENNVFRTEGFWRFTHNKRHRLGLSWFSFRRSGTKEIGDQITIQPPDGGEEIVIDPGTRVKTYFDLDIYQLNYSYSFLQDDRIDFAGLFGLYIMPISFGIEATGLVEEEANQSFTAPLPVIGLTFDVLLAPKWYFRSGSQIFYVQYDRFTGSLVNIRSAIEYNPWKHVGFGVGVDALRLGLKADGSGDYPNVDLKGELDFGYTGVLLYGRVFF